MDDMNLENILELQMAVNHEMYDHIAEMYQRVVDLSDDSIAVSIILSAVTTNLGMLISQIPESHQESYLKVANMVLNKSIAAGAERFDELTYGQVGHA